MKTLLVYRIEKVLLQDNGYYKSKGILNVYQGLNLELLKTFKDTPPNKSYKAVSGGGSTNGTLPIGLYKISLVTALADTKNNVPYKGEGFPWFARLDALGNCTRTGLAIHPDGNLPGTAGCLGVLENDIELYENLKSVYVDGIELIVV